MKNYWKDEEAGPLNGDPLALRVYTSRLLGKESDLVLHGGGNTSVKAPTINIFGEKEDILYVKGSGWDLATIEAEGFAPVRLDVLLKMAELDELSDPDMVKFQRAAMIDPNAPNPSVEAILHAIIPFAFVDHSHADAVVTITNTPNGLDRIRSIYGDRVLIVPYVMPGFILAKKIHEMTSGLDWNSIEGMILMNHGVFTFSNSAKASYNKMIALVSEAEDYLKSNTETIQEIQEDGSINTEALATIRNAVSTTWKHPVLIRSDREPKSVSFSNRTDLMEISQRGPVTPDHIIRTKRIPLLIDGNFRENVQGFEQDYLNYYRANADDKLTCLDPAPRWAVWPGHGTLAFGKSLKDTRIIRDISQHTMKAIQQAEQLEKWQALPEKDLFEMEYWVLEQAKLAKSSLGKVFQGKIAMVSGAASGIGRACVEKLRADGSVVAALDIAPMDFKDEGILVIPCDMTDQQAIDKAVNQTVSTFGGLDIVISNAGTFPPSHKIEAMDNEVWSKSIDINLTGHQLLMTAAIPFLALGIDASFVIIGSKNVQAPGPGAGAYSVAKAGLTQLARIASLELGEKGIRVNVIHPNAVYDTGIWTPEVLNARADHYGITVEEYKTNNVLKKEVRSADVAELAAAMAGPLFGKTTGAQIPIDGGNDRVI